MGEPWPRNALGALEHAHGLALTPESPVESRFAPHAALALYASLLDADTVAAGAHRLAASLAKLGPFDRVTVGLVDAARVRLIACSNIEVDELPPELEQAILGAMDEAMEQGQSLSSSTPAHDTGSIRLCQRALQQNVGGAVATIPLGADGQRIGAVCVERRNAHDGPPFVADELERLGNQLSLAAPAMRWMQAATEPWHRRVRRDALRHWAALRQPERRTRRRLIGATCLLVGFLACVPLEDTVAGRARIEGAQQRVLAAPADGFVKTAHVRPGDRVKQGDPLVDLLDADLRLERERWSSQLAQHENAYAAAMASSDRVSAATSMARASEAQAQLALIDEQLARGRLVAPFDAQVIEGDLTQSIGAPVRQGDALMTLATTGRHRVIVEVDEVDIARIEAGQGGRLALSSLPWEHEELVVERIAPLARAVDGRNVFEVEARLVAPRDDLRAGLLGRAEFGCGRAPLLWSWTRHALLRLRVAIWSWLA